MFEKLELTRMAQTMAAQAGTRLGVIAQNVANADTPGYKAADMSTFAESYSEPDIKMRATRAGHFGGGDLPAPAIHHSNGGGSPNGNTVSLEQEMVKAASARQDHEMALAIYRNTSSILRAALGRQG